jgi:hypothetical protein
MIESLVFNSALRIVEKLTDLLKFRHEQRREFFTTVLEPLFADLSTMHADYLRMFEACSSQLRDDAIPLRDIGRTLARQRVEYEALRIKIGSFIEALSFSKKLASPYREFLQSVAFSMPDGRLAQVVVGSFATGIVRLLRDASGAEFAQLLSGERESSDMQYERATLLQSVEETADFVKTQWSQTCQRFVAAQVFSLT